MAKYAVYGTISASVKIGEYEADSPTQAQELADKDDEANWQPSLCWQCSREVELGDVYETQVEEID